MADESILIKLDLDNKDFLNALKDSESGILGLSDTKNLKGLVEGFDSLLPLIGSVSVAVLALKTAMETVFDAESIKAINEQFEILSSNAGVAGDKLKEGLENAAGGLIDTTDLLKSANEALVKLGGSAAKLPELMEVARKASVITGQDLKSTFDLMVQAVESGNQRLLRRAGISVDVTKAEKDYAASLGISSAALSDAEKRQAILNATIEMGQTKLAGIDPDIKGATNAWQQFKVALNEIKETAALVFDKLFGPTVISGLKALADGAKSIGDHFKIQFGDAKQQAEGLKGSIASLQKELERLEDGDLSFWEKLSPKTVQEKIDRITDSIEKQQQKLDALKASSGSAESGTRTPAAEGGGEDQANYEKRAQEESKFQKELTAIRAEGVRERAEVVMSEADVDQVLADRKLQISQDYLAKNQQIITSEILTEEQKQQMLEQNYTNYQSKLTATALKAEDDRQALLIKSLDNQGKATDKFFTQFAAGAAKSSAQAKKEFTDFTELGAKLTNKLSNATSQAFAEVGQGSKDLGTAMKQAVLGALADEAQARGAVLIASSIFPPNPLGLAAGAGLSLLAGVLRGAAGGGGSSAIATPSTAAGGGVVGAESVVASAGDTTATQQQAQKKSVTIQIQGNYFDTDQTRIRLAEIIRDSADANDFKISSVGSIPGSI